MRRMRRTGMVLLLACAPPMVFAADDGAASQNSAAPAKALTPLAEVVVVGTTPMPGSGIDIDKVPSNVQTMSARDLDRPGGGKVIPSQATDRMGSVSLNDEQGNPYQPDFVYRGFAASPISGVAQGLAIYQDGTRINEAFGDSVNWDLVPMFAVDRLTVQGNNPVFGLNALGGAVTLDMKNGFNSSGSELQASGGSWNQRAGYAGSALRAGNFGFYAGVGGFDDDGFRDRSHTIIRQAYADAGYEDGTTTLHLTFSGADNTIGAVGPTPIEMLADDPKSVFTYPQAMHNESALVQLRGSVEPSPTQSLSAQTYYRRFNQHLIDGNTTDAEVCENDDGYFCFGGDGEYPDDALYDDQGNPVSTSVIADGATAGEIDRTRTKTDGAGASAQWTLTAPLFGRPNHFVAGASYDHGSTGYGAYGELGTLADDLEVTGAGVVIDQGQSATASPPIVSPVRVRARNAYTGLYFTNTLDLTSRLAWSLSGRYNHADISLRDRRGDTLDSDNRFSRFNPGTGVTYRIAEKTTAYAGWSQANRAPTAGELNCADPESPCLLGAFLVDDPPLKQVVSNTYEAGLRGRIESALPGRLSWNVGLFRTDNRDDILLIATEINGFGYFSNAGKTRRQGVETALSYKLAHWKLHASYSFIDATFRDALTIASNSPSADDEGNIDVRSGDRIPLMPRHRLTLQADYKRQRWSAGAELRAVSSQYYAGDASNQQKPLGGYATVDLHGTYAVTHALQLFAEVENLLDRTYYTYATYTELDDGLPPSLDLNDPRTLSPSPGRAAYAGLRLSF
ncbi:TonB-dependent receptor [Solimonas marina]|uniref:TonB-dependent receptor n=1 Tax=Solimonas marina TaxID=2714601 RepID=A0A969WDN7_9GAMM|nr:TonB-dependent receptor [Solimonas marina]NKF24644.1 TonB-dependent receptor [Solimonas marina]